MADITLSFVTLDDLMALGEDARVEVIEGEVVEMSPVGFAHVQIAGNVYRILYEFVTANNLGIVSTDGLLYLLDADAAQLRGAQVPDVSFLRQLPDDFDLDKPVPGAPDLAVEVVSPNDDAEILLTRIQKYLQFGTEQVWVLYPRLKELHLYRRDQMDTVKIYRAGDTLTAETLFPGLAISISGFFILPTPRRDA
jgi:Uma2 family endonuclease